MIKALLLTFAIIFAALGICDFIHTLRSGIMFPDIKTKKYCVLFLKSGHAVSQLRYFAFKIRWYGSEFCDGLIAVSDDLLETEYAACERFCYGLNIRLCRFENMDSVINELEIGVSDEEKLNA